ncbi:MAG: T9SS type A sorting domain-containing protein, partial [Candidatus Marinimicrobia bacterium]|nr:T9SS type A sorting domain-containing protein [Candidatus Neomarinimicrobiota bacterium]
NYPNPFNPVTTLKYALPTISDVKILIYNIQGKEIFKCDLTQQLPGYYNFTWNGRNNNGILAASGIYFYSLKTNDDIATRKMLLIK